MPEEREEPNIFQMPTWFKKLAVVSASIAVGSILALNSLEKDAGTIDKHFYENIRLALVFIKSVSIVLGGQTLIEIWKGIKSALQKK